ncbi:Lethal(2) giant larvae -like protein 1 [Echinococcus granulosus]|nr:Lethal(2) giant larvae -like protein 1 [Echinococcus granulosus]
MEQPIALAYDQDLCLFAVAYTHGYIEVYGMPGLSFPVDHVVKGIKFMEFLQNEGRLLLVTSSSLTSLELNVTSGHWEKKHSVFLPLAPDESITAFAIGKGVVYVGSSAGTLRQVAIENGTMTVGDDDLTSLPCLLILNKLPEDKREVLKLNTPIVSIELHPNGEGLLLGYAGGTAIVAQPQAIPLTLPVPSISTVENPRDEAGEKPEEGEAEKGQTQPSIESVEAEAEPAKKSEGDTAPEPTSPKKSKTGERHSTANLQAIRAQASRKFRTLSKSIKSKIEHTAEEKVEHPVLPVPPSPRVVRLLPYTQVLCCATWRITTSVLASELAASQEVLIAYHDGAYLTWTIPKCESEVFDPVIAVNQEVASIPYGPLPCAAIQRIIARPSANGGVITAFVGGLPRAQHAQKHTISVLGGVEEHVCFQFGSPVRDFVVLPSKPQKPACRNEENEESSKQKIEGDEGEKSYQHITEPPKPTDAGYLLVLTDRELVAIDLTQPSWPVIPSPYLKHLDCTGITAVAHISIPKKLMSRLKEACNAKGFDHWPVIGGQKTESCEAVVEHAEFHDLVAIAHMDADVSLWHVGRGDCFESLGRIPSLAMMLDAGELGCNVENKQNEEEAWPPFRKVGDCVCEALGERVVDARCAVRTLSFQLVDEEVLLFVGGEAGNCSMWSSAKQKSLEPDVTRICVDLLEGLTDKFSWEGHEAFKPIEGAFKPHLTSTPAFGLCELIQFNPPSAITAVTFEPHWEALAIGSAHGFALIDLKSHAVVYKHLTYGLQGTTETSVPSVARGAATKIVAGGRHLKATLRQSFRKIRKSRSRSAASVSEEAGEEKKVSAATETATEAAPVKAEEVGAAASGVVDETLDAAVETDETAKPGGSSEEAPTTKSVVVIEEKDAEPSTCQQLKPNDTTSGVSALILADTYVIPGVVAAPKENRPASSPPRTAALIVGTQNGALIIHTLSWPAEDALIEVKPIKAVFFRHGAAVLAACVIDAKAHSSPVLSEKSRSVPEVIPESPEPVKQEAESTKHTKGEENGSKPGPMVAVETAVLEEVEQMKSVLTSSHELLVCTEEQVRVIALPSLRTKHKYHFWEKTATGIHGTFKHTLIRRRKSEPSTTATTSDDVAVSAAQENTETKETDASVVAPVAISEPDSIEQGEKSEELVAATNSAAPCVSLRRVVAFGLQQFPQPSSAMVEECHAVVALRNGRLHVLTIPGLRRVLKATFCDHPEYCSTKPMPTQGFTNVCVSNSANLTFWPFAGCMLVANEISYALPCRLASLVGVTGLRATGEAAYCVCLPEWARPKTPPTPVTPSVASAAPEDPGSAFNYIENGHDKTGKGGKTRGSATDGTMEAMKGTIADPMESSDTAKEVDTFTKDITKGILTDGSGTVTVKTTESSLEKHTVIEGGNVLTTVRETQLVDGEIVKDDIVQVKSDVDESAPATVGTGVTG